jgi:hypothetical protein
MRISFDELNQELVAERKLGLAGHADVNTTLRFEVRTQRHPVSGTAPKLNLSRATISS